MSMLEVASVAELALLAQLADALMGMTEHAIQTSVALKGISDTTDINVKSLQEWNQIARETSGTSDWIAGGFNKIAASISDIHLNRNSQLSSLADVVDISGLKDVDDLLNRISKSKKLMSMSHGDLSNRLSMAGIDPRFQMALRLSEAQRQAMRNRAPVLTDKEMKNFTHIEEEFAKLHAHSERFKNSVATWSAPELLKTITAAAEILDHLRLLIDEDTKRGEKGYIGKSRDVIGGVVTSPFAAVIDAVNSVNERRAEMFKPENTRRVQSALGRTPTESDLLSDSYRRFPRSYETSKSVHQTIQLTIPGPHGDKSKDRRLHAEFDAAGWDNVDLLMGPMGQ